MVYFSYNFAVNLFDVEGLNIQVGVGNKWLRSPAPHLPYIDHWSLINVIKMFVSLSAYL